MPKNNTSVNARLQAFVSEFGDDNFSSVSTILYCNFCNVKVASETMLSILKIINGEENLSGEYPASLYVENLAHFKFGLITLVDAEKCFSKHKYLLPDNRYSINFDNLKRALIV